MLIPFLPTFPTEWECKVLPAEHIIESDATSGATIIFVTSDPASDTNLYFHDRCFLWNNRVMIFNSNRYGRQEVMAYLLDTGQLVRLNRPDDLQATHPLASRNGKQLFVIKHNSIYQWSLNISTTPETSVRISETKIIDFPTTAAQNSGLAENCDQSLLAFAYTLADKGFIAMYNFNTKQTSIAAEIDLSLTIHNFIGIDRTFFQSLGAMEAIGHH